MYLSEAALLSCTAGVSPVSEKSGGGEGGVQSGGNKRDKLKGTNAQDSQFFADFRRFLLIFAFPGNCSISGAQIFAENRRKPQKTAGNRRFLQKPVCPI